MHLEDIRNRHGVRVFPNGDGHVGMLVVVDLSEEYLYLFIRPDGSLLQRHDPWPLGEQ